MDKISNRVDFKCVPKKSLFLICIFSFLIYADKLYEFPLEPWILNKYGEKMFLLFSLILIILILLNAFGVILAGFISHKFDRKKVLIISILVSGTLVIFAPFLDLIGFIICFAIIQIFAGFILINMTSYMIDLSKKSVILFQVMISFTILARVIFVPVGTYLSIFIATELIILIAGLLILLSVIPILFIKDENSNE